jgi:hypothetical protein
VQDKLYVYVGGVRNKDTSQMRVTFEIFRK